VAGLVLIPLIFLNIRQYEGFVGASNISHGSMPVFLLMLYSLAWLCESSNYRLLALVLLNFLLVFTGFGVFVGVITPFLLLVELVHSWRGKCYGHVVKCGLALAAALAALVVFSWGYIFAPAVDGFRFPYEKPVEYLYFVNLMFSNFFGIQGHGILPNLVGFIVTLSLLFISVSSGVKLILRGMDGNRDKVVVFLLASFAILYAFNTAVGRVFLGLENAPFASRYVPLLVPGILALFIYAGLLKSRVSGVVVISILIVGMVLGTLRLSEHDQTLVAWYRGGRIAWRDAYLKTGSQSEADRLANFKIFPAQLDWRIDSLKQRKLNFYHD
jgi:hypothetical protein